MSRGIDADSLDAQRLTTAHMEEQRADLSTVVLCDHGAQFMQTLLEVLAQQDIPLEVLVICASECTIQMEQLPGGRHKVRQLRAPAGSSTAAQRNLALTASSSDFLVFVENGDRLVPGALSKLLATLKRHPSSGLAHGYWFPVDEMGRTTLTEMRARRATLMHRIPIDLN